MDAMMVGLLGAALATVGGRWWRCASALLRANAAGSALPILVSTGIAAVISALAGGWIAAEVRGPGLLLLLALSLITAGGGALWPVRGDATEAFLRPVGATIVLTAAQITESAPFIILAVAAWSGDAVLSGIGGGFGMLAALTATALPQLIVDRVRVAAGTVLLIIGAWCAIVALGLI